MSNSPHFETTSLEILRRALVELDRGFALLPAAESDSVNPKELERILLQTARRLHENYPYFHPLYAGQMLKPPHAIARLAATLALWINPNNHALDGGRASSAMEKEAVAEIGRLWGWDSLLGHLTSGGTMANLEALWIAGQLRPGETIVASQQAHYTHGRLSRVLQLPFESVATDNRGRMDLSALQKLLRTKTVGTVVATVGTTACGAVDPVDDLLELRAQHGFRLHIDAAYGGYFVLADNLERETQRAYARLGEADSIVIDPHKHGLQPYGCGCVLFKDPAVGRFYRHDSPYTYFTSEELHLGEISLECSRPGAAAVALWATQQLFPLVRQGLFAQMLQKSRQAALELHARLAADSRFLPFGPPELDIVTWVCRAASVSSSSARAEQIFREAARRDLHLALATLPCPFFDLAQEGIAVDQPQVRCLRSVLMKPEHRGWIDEIWRILNLAAA